MLKQCYRTLHLPRAGESLEGRILVDWDDAFFSSSVSLHLILHMKNMHKEYEQDIQKLIQC